MQQMPGAAIKKDRKPVFTGGDQGWVDLKLSAVEEVSHNVKKLRFELPDSESVSGLHIACSSAYTHTYIYITDTEMLIFK